MLSPEAITKFRAIYKKLYGTEIDSKTAEEQGGRLINFMKIILNSENAVKKHLSERG